MSEFPSLKGRALLRVLQREPLAYRIVRQRGSHRILHSPNGYPPLTLAFHESVSIGGAMVRKVLVHDVGLVESDALWLLRTGGLP